MRDDYIIPAEADEGVLLEYFRSVDSDRVRPIVVVGSAKDFAFVVSAASKTFYDFEFIWVAPPLHNPIHPHVSFQAELDLIGLGEHLNSTGGIWCLSPPVISDAAAALEAQLQATLLSRYPAVFRDARETRDALLAFDLLSSLSNAIDQHGPLANVASLMNFVTSNPVDGVTGTLFFDAVQHVREGVAIANWIRSPLKIGSQGSWRTVGTWNGSNIALSHTGDLHFWRGPVPVSKIPSDIFPRTEAGSCSLCSKSNNLSMQKLSPLL